MTKRISEWLKKAVDYLKVNLVWILMLAFSIAVGIVAGVLVYMSFDTVPATSADYEPLENQLAYAQEKLDTLDLQQTAPITAKDQTMEVKVSNKECSITVKYDENFKVISTTRVDFSTVWWGVGILSLLAVCFAFFIGCMIYLIILGLLDKIFEWMKSKFIKKKDQ